MLMVVAPTRRELGGLSTGSFGEVQVAVTGLGAAATTQALAVLLGQHMPVVVVSLGFAGGLTIDVNPGDLVLCDKVTGGVMDEAIVPEGDLLELAMGMAQRCHIPCRQGGLATVSAPLLTTTAKARLREETGAMAVDMEGYWLARDCRRAGIPILLARAILDPTKMTLPTMVQSIVDDQGYHEIQHTVMHLLRRPWHIGQVLNLAVNAHRAAKALECAIQKMVIPMATSLQEPEEQ